MTKVLIVDDHPIFRDGLAGLLATLPEIEITGTVGTASEALTAIKHNPPDVVLMDIRLPDGVSGFKLPQAIEAAPATAILVITMVDDDDTVMAALAAGARGYILKKHPATKSPPRCARWQQEEQCSAPGSPHASSPPPQHSAPPPLSHPSKT